MLENAYLLCEIKDESDKDFLVKSWLHDDSEFEIGVPKHKVKLIENSNPKKAWVTVLFSGEDTAMRASITLPSPSLQYGHKVTVATKNIMRPDKDQREVKETKL